MRKRGTFFRSSAPFRRSSSCPEKARNPREAIGVFRRHQMQTGVPAALRACGSRLSQRRENANHIIRDVLSTSDESSTRVRRLPGAGDVAVSAGVRGSWIQSRWRRSASVAVGVELVHNPTQTTARSCGVDDEGDQRQRNITFQAEDCVRHPSTGRGARSGPLMLRQQHVRGHCRRVWASIVERLSDTQHVARLFVSSQPWSCVL